MDWLKDHTYLATWCSLVLALVVALAKLGGKAPAIDWHEIVGIVLLLTAVGAAFTPGLDETSKGFARTLFFFLAGYGVLRITRR
jgi:hypothetical protein